ncbi:MAG: ABC transporter ATP-binding protein/permease [Rickettsiales bacterium]|jgi:ATP-binding cassette subfamily B protein|nr:ABC transporter ATP-binding protein/permease [Rickettsiales bacterium]
MQKELPKTLYPFIWHFLRKYKITVAIFVFLSLMAGLWGPFNSLLLKNIVNLSVDGKNVSVLILPISLIVINFILFDNFTWRGIDYIRSKYVPYIINSVVSETVEFVLGKSYQFYQDHLTGKISKQITNLADGIEKLITDVASNFLRGFSTLMVTFIVIYFVNYLFFITMLIWIIFFVSISVAMSKKLSILSNIQASRESKIVGEMVDSLSNHNNIRIFAQSSYEKLRMIPFFKKQREAYSNNYFYAFILHCVQGGLMAILMGISAYWLVLLYSEGLVTIGDFVLILGLSMETAHIMWWTMSVVDDFNIAIGKCKQSIASLMEPIEIQDQENATSLNCSKGEIVFDKVKFHYKGSTPLFEDKSITIKPGQKVGLVGYSGSGKTTFVNLILRLYEINEGKILIDGQDIKTVTQDSLRKNIAMIPQDPTLFHRSIMDNIAYGKMGVSEEEVIEAAKKAHADEFINNLLEGYDSLVGERGIKLSGGQRQRISIARAFLKDGPILILDEATSQLDSIIENYIQDSLFKLMEDKTTLVIAHRLSTLLHMDRILVFDKGKIVQDGSHEELLSQGGLYKTMWNAQVGGFLPERMESNYE